MGHRGFSHSITFALIIGLSGALPASRLGVRRTTAFVILFLSVLSHGLLDAMTSGGLGVAFFSPFSNERFFLPWRVISVSPLSVERFITRRGLEVLKSEFIWIWLPSFAAGCLGWLCRLLFHRLRNR
jgi:inner membrane protein